MDTDTVSDVEYLDSDMDRIVNVLTKKQWPRNGAGLWIYSYTLGCCTDLT